MSDALQSANGSSTSGSIVPEGDFEAVGRALTDDAVHLAKQGASGSLYHAALLRQKLAALKDAVTIVETVKRGSRADQLHRFRREQEIEKTRLLKAQNQSVRARTRLTVEQRINVEADTKVKRAVVRLVEKKGELYEGLEEKNAALTESIVERDKILRLRAETTAARWSDEKAERDTRRETAEETRDLVATLTGLPREAVGLAVTDSGSAGPSGDCEGDPPLLDEGAPAPDTLGDPPSGRSGGETP